jgi:hypothetical protein
MREGFLVLISVVIHMRFLPLRCDVVFRRDLRRL